MLEEFFIQLQEFPEKRAQGIGVVFPAADPAEAAALERALPDLTSERQRRRLLYRAERRRVPRGAFFFDHVFHQVQRYSCKLTFRMHAALERALPDLVSERQRRRRAR